MNFSATILSFVCSFLSGRAQYVEVNQEQSSILPINLGAPQGTVLGPICFNASTNHLDVAEIDENFVNLVKFADDKYLLVACHESTDSSDLKFNRVVDWLTTNKFIVNEKKTKLLVIKFNKNCRPAIGLFQPETTMKILGISVDDKFSMSPHVSLSCSKAMRNLYLVLKLKRLGYRIEETSKVFSSLVHSILFYGIEAVAALPRTEIRKIENVLRKGVKWKLTKSIPDVIEIIKQRDAHLLQMVMEKENHPLNEFIPNRPDYCTNKLRKRLPSTSKNMNKNIFPNRALLFK